MKEIFDPIRSHYTFSDPCHELRDHIDFISESIVTDFHFTVEMFPSFTPTMYINLANNYSITLSKSTYSVDRNMDVLILRDVNTTRHNPPGDRIFTVKFHPGGLESILGISQLHLKRKIVPLNQVVPQRVIGAIKNSSTFDARKKIMEQWLIENAVSKKSDHYLNFVHDLAESYQQSAMQFNVGQLAEKHFITTRTVNRYFHRVIGISPKEYFSILRARTALTAYTNGRHLFDPCKFGYYDHSHFYKEAAKFTGCSLNHITKNETR